MGWGFRTPPGLHLLYTSTAGWGCLELLSPMERARDTPQAVSATCRGGEGSVPRVRGPHYSLTLANGMGFSHTTWTTPPIHEHSGMGLPRATLTYG